MRGHRILVGTSASHSGLTMADRHDEGRWEKFQSILAEVEVLKEAQDATRLRWRRNRLDLVVSEVESSQS